jgi:UDP-N-acetyl-D-mannosaminuronate dehydrogenase
MINCNWPVAKLHYTIACKIQEKDIWINQNLDELLMNDYDVVVITTGHKDYRNNETCCKTGG